LAQHQGELQTAAFATGEEPDGRPLRVVVEPQPLQQRGVCPVRLPGGSRKDLAHAQVER
jgi:hypothetical protein